MIYSRAGIAALLAASLLAGCGGASSSGSAPIPNGVVPATQGLTVRMTINGPSGASTSSNARTPQFVSPSTNGVLAQAYSDSGYSNLVAQNAVDLSSASAACGGTTGFPRTCSVTIGVAAGTYWMKFTDYDAAPVSGAFAGAHVLGTGTVPDFSVQSGVFNQLSIFISGLITSVGVANVAFASLPADGNDHSVGLVLAPTDADGNPIGTSNAPYANPITVTLTESGGSGHAALIKNGGVASSSVSSTLASDSIVLSYDGKGTPGYTDSIAISATGAATQTLAVSPLYVASTSALFTGGALNFTAPSQSATLDLTEAHAPGGVTYTATPSSGCSGVISLGSVGGGGTAASVSATSGTTLSATGCSITLADSLGTLTQLIVDGTNTGSGGSITIPGAGIVTEFPTGGGAGGRPYSIAAGPDGNLWFAAEGGAIGRITPNGTVTDFTAGLSGHAIPTSIAAGPDGNLWFTEPRGNRIGRITPDGTITEFTTGITPGASPLGIAAGSDGNLWFAENGLDQIGQITPNGTVREFSAGISPGAAPFGIAAGSDGNLWFTEQSGNRIGRITTDGTVTEFSTGIAAGAQPEGIAAGADGNLWFAESGLDQIGQITPGGAVTEFSAGVTAGAEPVDIAAGPDGNLWFTEVGSGGIGRITPGGTVSEFSAGITSGAGPTGITAGPDGNLWFTEVCNNSIGRIAP